MNVAQMMIPKVSTVFMHENNTVRQGLELCKRHRYTTVPVLDDKACYIGCVTEGDLLRHVMEIGTTDLRAHESYKIGSIIRRDFYPALRMDANREEIIAALIDQNFVPIVDDRGALCGIITRRSLIERLAK